MMNNEIAIKAVDLSKKFCIKKTREINVSRKWGIRDIFFKTLFHNKKEYFYALKDVNFEIKAGEIVGIIGRNGAGKSTLLHILSEITSPSKGYVEIKDKIASFIDIGLGFHQELSGRDNIFISGALLGLKKNEIIKVIDNIVAYSGIEKFIDTPVKHYSKGMYIRLAFSIIAHMEADVYLFDEVLIFGDADFRKKCIHKISELISKKKTIIMVSHNLNEILLCNRVLYLEKGVIKAMGSPQEILSTYIDDIYKLISEKQRLLKETGDSIQHASDNDSSENPRLISFQAYAKDSAMSLRTIDEIVLEIEYELISEQAYEINILVNDYNDYPLFISSTITQNISELPHSSGIYKVKCILPQHLLGAGTFIVRVSFIDKQNLQIRDIRDVFLFKVTEEVGGEDINWNKLVPRPIRPKVNWIISKIQQK